MSLQAAIPEGDSEEEPLKPTDRQAINHKIKKCQDLKEKSENLKSSIEAINHKIKKCQDLKENLRI